MWRIIFWVRIILQFSGEPKLERAGKLSAFLKKKSGEDCRKFSSIFDGIFIESEVEIDPASLSDISLSIIIEEVKSFIEAEGRRVYFFFDVIEDLDTAIARHAFAISGLMRACSQMVYESDYVKIRYCLPAEQYNEFMLVSSNPAKDFPCERLCFFKVDAMEGGRPFKGGGNPISKLSQ